MSLLDHVVLSCDDNPKFADFWPIVASAWEKLFNVQVFLGWVTDKKDVPPGWISAQRTVIILPPVPGVPSGNQAKLARYFIAANFAAGVVSTNDVDLLPLQQAYFGQLLDQRPPGHLLTIGSELYTGKETGKFTAGYLTAEAAVWQRLINPSRQEWPDWIKSFIGLRHFDHKEDVASQVHHEASDTFSDESVLRYLLSLRPVPAFHAPRGFNPYTARSLDRNAWDFDPAKLARGGYVEAHLPRPFSEHAEKIQPLIDYLK